MIRPRKKGNFKLRGEAYNKSAGTVSKRSYVNSRWRSLRGRGVPSHIKDLRITQTGVSSKREKRKGVGRPGNGCWGGDNEGSFIWAKVKRSGADESKERGKRKRAQVRCPGGK